MKNKILLLTLTVSIAIMAFAAGKDKIEIITINGNSTTYNISEIEEVTFIGDQMIITDNNGTKEYDVTEVSKVCRKNNDERAVDLGLSVMWASMNIGATKPGDYGSYFAWGETTTKSSYTASNSKWYEKAVGTLLSQGVIDSDDNLTSQYDAATVIWGSEWRMPTRSEINELFNNCTWIWTKQDGHDGYKVTGPNGNSIFLPAAGCYHDTTLHANSGNYWSATAVNNPSYGYQLNFNSTTINSSNTCRYYGQTIRPVTK